MKSFRFKSLGALAGLSLALAGTPACAALIASDSFTYDVSASTNLFGKNGGTGWTTAWTNANLGGTPMTIVNSGTPLNAANQSGGSQSVSIPGVASSAMAGYRTFAAQTGEVWFSLLLRTPSAVGSDDFLQFALNNDNDQNNSASIGDTNTSASGGDKFSVRIGTSNGGTTASGTQTIAGGTDYFLVGRVSKDGVSGNVGGFYDKVEMWLSPTNALAPDAGTLVTTEDASSQMTTISFFTFRAANFINTPYVFDELRIGTDYVSVTPEPASLTGVALMVMGLLRRHRRA